MARPTFAEDELGKRWDRCIYDGILKIGGGLSIGVVGSLLFFKRRSWPLVFGSAFGLGLAYGNCQREIKGALTLPPSTVTHKSSN
ncbi:MICOS complex subunit MIC10-like [Lycorma delicatula]|uniref:MICOS complex subunit MIC10-like n=1 Tax=Lycorma delicatula TaxID=130591 RepID=UPI003F513C0C